MDTLPERTTVEELHSLLRVKQLSRVPSQLCTLMKGHVCVIWKPSRSSKSVPEMEADVAPLYPYSSNFSNRAGIQHAGICLHLEKDTTGRFFSSGDDSMAANWFVRKDEQSPCAEFCRKERLAHVCLARFEMRIQDSEDDGPFVACVYRREDQPEFEPGDQERLKFFAGFLPVLYHRLVASQLRGAIVEVNEILRAHCANFEDAREPMERLCQRLATFFQTIEVSAFMQDEIGASDRFDLFASTVDRRDFRRTSYTSSLKDGVTGYVLTVKRPIWFHDLRNFDIPVRRKIIEHRYPGIEWGDGADFRRLAKAKYKLPDDALTPPMPFLGVPILSESGNVVGALRMSLGLNPFYFLNAQIDAVSIIAREIGRWWESILHRVEQDRRGAVWEALDKTVRAQHEYLKGSSDDMSGLARVIVQSIAEQPGFDVAAFRRGSKADALKLTAVAWSFREKDQYHSEARCANLRNAIVPLGAPIEPPKQNRGFFIQEIRRRAGAFDDRADPESLLFEGMSDVLSYAVIIKSQLYGVLDIGLRNERDLRLAEERIRQFGEIVARQLAVFERIAEMIEQVERAKNNEVKAYRVVTHQLKSPLFNASRRLRGLTAGTVADWSESKSHLLLKVEGMVRKARGVTNLIETLGKLVAGESVRAKLSQVRASDLWKLCLEVAQNARELADSRMGIDFVLEPTTQWSSSTLYWFRDFAEQCVDAVISNAFKYSAPNRIVRIVGVPEGSSFTVRVVNVGPYHINKEEVERCKEQNWRGQLAQEREGAGIGLWITDKLMEAQSGELRILPTNLVEETQIELRFSARR